MYWLNLDLCERNQTCINASKHKVGFHVICVQIEMLEYILLLFVTQMFNFLRQNQNCKKLVETIYFKNFQNTKAPTSYAVNMP
jgi:hypothetical protein